MRRLWGVLIGVVSLGAGLWWMFAGGLLAHSGAAERTPGSSGSGATARLQGASATAQEVPETGALLDPEAGRGQGSEDGKGADSEVRDSCWLTGRVTDEEGHPLSRIVLEAHVTDHRTFHPGDSMVTEEDGLFRLGLASPGNYSLYADGEGYVETRLSVELLAPCSQTLDIMLQRAVLVQGSVVDEAGQSIPDVQVSLLRPRKEGGEGEEEEVLVSTESGEDGTFSLDAPGPGNYTVHLSHEEHLTTERTVTAPVRGARLVMDSGAIVEAEVVDELERPVAEAMVQLLADPLGDSEALKTDATSDSGQVTLTGLEPGKYTLVAATPGAGHLRIVERAVELQESERRRVRLRFEEGLRLSGVVVDGAGRPVEGARVQAVPAGPEDSGPSGRTALESSFKLTVAGWDSEAEKPLLTGPDGRFTVNHLKRGSYFVTAQKEGYVLDRRSETRRAVDSPPGVLVPAGTRDARVVLEFQGLVRGRVVRADGSPITRFHINRAPRGDERGEFRWRIEHSGEQVLSFTAPGVAGTERKVHVRRGELVDLGDVVLRPGREVRVRVVDAETSMPVPHARPDLRVSSVDESELDRSLLYQELVLVHMTSRTVGTRAGGSSTGEDGTAVIPNVEERPLVLLVHHDDYLTASVPLGAEQREVEVALRAGARVEGTVRDGTAPVEDGVVELFTPQRVPVSQATITRGAYSFGPLKEGSYLLRARSFVSEGPVPVFLPRPVEVPATGKRTLDLEAWRGGAAVEVNVSEQARMVILVPGWTPLPGTREQLERAIAFGCRNVGGREDGHFRFQSVPPGQYTLFAVRDWSAPELEVHREEVEVPAKDAVSLPVRPRWQRVGSSSPD
ncbi:carboxypeptidase-like regulatory domain-containing protein [Vitiosangium sp. GDMCC 1.1324]|uniref:carboxypeptidase regulatory-like domain-containing protein n=1 Tax=Vitiosangium sp. (strain GDMCC 1.1324) TaxID=2138576 RepID=UPI000D3AB5A7|nr:carboxypeptidase-like regulatory domain-containing protein [Vitiosangium sp. GDMCC 1.1324]PTL85493.1 hypothetical protein DAT35_01875 [Vitiosangium sp. GDMCC 1.1324]